MDEMGMFRGKGISEMTRDELLEFAKWAGRELWRLSQIEKETQDYRIKREIESAHN